MLGHTQHPAAAGIVCSCGSESHLESVASGSGSEDCYRRAGGEALPVPEISKRAEQGEVLAESIIEQAGRSFGEAIGSWAKIVDPDLVVISGSVCAAGPLWRDALEAGLKSQLAKEQEDLKLVEATLGGSAPLVGAAEKLVDKVLCR